MRVSGRELPKDWFPYSPRGPNGSMDGITVTSYEYPRVHWIDENGISGESDIRRAMVRCHGGWTGLLDG